MAASFSSQVTLVHRIVETLTTAEQPLLDSSDNTTSAFASGTRTSDGTSSPAVTAGASFNATLSTGALTVDLTAITDIRGVSISFNGKKIRDVTFVNPITNANQIQVKAGAASGHLLLGAAWSIILQPGDLVTVRAVDAGNQAVGGSNKNWDLVGTGSQVLQIIASAG